MVKCTLLEMVQRILAHINSDYCNSLEDDTVTEEALAVAEIIRDTYFHLLLTREIKTKENFIHFDVLSNTAKPTYLKFQDNVVDVDYFAYKDTEGNYIELQYKAPTDFLKASVALDSSALNVQECVDTSGYTLKVITDSHPKYWTSFNNEHVILDSFEKSVESTIQSNKLLAHGVYLPTFTIADDFVPDIAPVHFPLLMSASKVAAGSNLKRMVDTIEVDRMKKELMLTDRLSRRTDEDTSLNIFTNSPKGGKRTR